MNRIKQLFDDKGEDILSIYFTAGYPSVEETVPILKALQSSGADLVEIGMPYSDPVADGPTIQDSNQQALAGGMSIKKLFEQLSGIRDEIDLPLILMGYINPIIQFGIEQFCQYCEKAGIDGLIIPDLPMFEYRTLYKDLFEKNGLLNIFLITPQTSEARIKEIDEVSDGFIYMVSSASITGAKGQISDDQIKYFDRVEALKLTNPRLIGFGISNRETFRKACEHANGAIIGSAFINLLKNSKNIQDDIHSFIGSIKH